MQLDCKESDKKIRYLIVVICLEEIDESLFVSIMGKPLIYLNVTKVHIKFVFTQLKRSIIVGFLYKWNTLKWLREQIISSLTW